MMPRLECLNASKNAVETRRPKSSPKMGWNALDQILKFKMKFGAVHMLVAHSKNLSKSG
jgi:hypothetical protein